MNTSANQNNTEANQWAMFVHFSLFAGFVVPIAGLVLPIILWQIKKDKFPIVDVHGKIVANWIISALIYSIICAALVFVFVGVVGFVALGIAAIIYPIIGGIKANNGEVWKYPYSLTLIK